mmetsp:Transcript_93309/g.226712  ORF Transcript_93309/g.226712 Transcript_93309/m.226712 type:complete len:262 (-) Transcript_93309:175-960(-)
MSTRSTGPQCAAINVAAGSQPWGRGETTHDVATSRVNKEDHGRTFVLLAFGKDGPEHPAIRPRRVYEPWVKGSADLRNPGPDRLPELVGAGTARFEQPRAAEDPGEVLLAGKIVRRQGRRHAPAEGAAQAGGEGGLRDAVHRLRVAAERGAQASQGGERPLRRLALQGFCGRELEHRQGVVQDHDAALKEEGAVEAAKSPEGQGRGQPILQEAYQQGGHIEAQLLQMGDDLGHAVRLLSFGEEQLGLPVQHVDVEHHDRVG